MEVLLSLGSNLGDREGHLGSALERLGKLDGTCVRLVSQCYETEPLGMPDQPQFLNLAAEIETALAPLALLNAAKIIEKELGRTPGTRWEARVIDIDIVLWGDTVLATPELTLPHKRFRNRAFVLTPMAEIAPDAIDPVSGLSIGELASRPQAEGRVHAIGVLDH